MIVRARTGVVELVLIYKVQVLDLLLDLCSTGNSTTYEKILKRQHVSEVRQIL